MTERFTEEQVRAAFAKGLLSAIPGMSDSVRKGMEDKAMAELTRPPIGPNVPVMFKDSLEDDTIDWMENMNLPKYAHATNIRVLIPLRDAREIARRAITRYLPLGANTVDPMAEVDRDLGAYAQGETS